MLKEFFFVMIANIFELNGFFLFCFIQPLIDLADTDEEEKTYAFAETVEKGWEQRGPGRPCFVVCHHDKNDKKDVAKV